MCETSARLDGHVVIITGGSAGIGLETAKDLAYRGARVILASRNETKLNEAKNEIIKATGNDNVDYRRLDLASLKSVRQFAAETVRFEKRLDVLLNNAGAVGLPDKLTEDDLNLTMQVNYFGAFLLTYLLLPFLKASAPSRIITSSAASKYLTRIDFDHWNDIGGNPLAPIASSQLSNELFSVELSRRLKGTGVTAISYDPFAVRDTDVFNNTPRLLQNVIRIYLSVFGLSKEEGGKQIAYLAAAPELDQESGMHFKFCRRFLKHWAAYDERLTKRLWEESKALVKVTDSEDWESMK